MRRDSTESPLYPRKQTFAAQEHFGLKKRTLDVRFTPNSGHKWLCRGMSAYDPKRKLAVPGLNAKAYFVKSLTEGVAPPSALHRITAVVRTRSPGDVKFENRTELLKSIAKGFSGNVFLDKCLGWDCVRYESTREDPNRPQFPGFVFVISKQGFAVLHPDSPRFVINLEYRQYFARGQQPLSQKALEIEVEPFQKSLEFTPIE